MTVQSILLAQTNSLITINDNLGEDDSLVKELAYLKENISSFKVVVPIVGKFSSGKSTLLNYYLGEQGYLATDIAPETAIATELCYSENPRIKLHYLDDTPASDHTIDELKTLNITERCAFLQVFLNNEALKVRPDIILVDMPGFDAQHQAHHKAIACYLERGDYFISLMPINIPFDHSVIERLAEIYFDYGKQVSCLLSKAASKTAAQGEENKAQLTKTLQDSLQVKVTVGTVETRVKDAINIADFEQLLDEAAGNFDTLLLARYRPQALELLTYLDKNLQQIVHLSEAGDLELKEQIIEAQAEFKRIESELQHNIASFENKLSNIGKEQLIQQARSALSGSMSQLASAAKSQNLNNVMAEILRPILQGGLNDLIQSELASLELKIGQINQEDNLNLNLSIHIPQQEKDNFLGETVAMVSSVVTLFMPQARIGKIIIAALGLLFGMASKSEPQDQQAQIEAQISNEVIPQAINQVISHLDTEIGKAAQHLKAQFMQSFNQERSRYEQLIQELQAQQGEKRQQYQAKCAEYKSALATLSTLKTELNQ